MFSNDHSSTQNNTNKQWPEKNVINALKYKHLLTLAICDLSVQIQQTGHTTTSSNFDIGLKIEHEAVSHIESLILDVFVSILVSSVNFNNYQTPEIAYSEAMSNSSSNISASTTISSLNSVESAASIFLNVSASPSTTSYKSYMNDNCLIPILDLNEAKSRVQQVLPHNYADTACSKAFNLVEKCRKFMSSTKRINKLLKSFGELQSISSNYRNNQSNLANNELAQIFKFPIDKIHNIMVKDIFQIKFDIFVTIYLVSILEFITKDILRLATVYVRCLGKHSINQIDVKTAIQADHALTKIFYSNNIASDDIFDMRDDYDDDEELAILSNDLFDSNSHKKEQISESKQKRGDNITPIHISQTTSNSNEECNSDSSTICAETVSIEKQNMKYKIKVKELLLEQNQYLNDLNILRRIFMYLFRKCCTQYDIKSPVVNCEQIIENIFGNINDLYDCSLRLADLLDENIAGKNQSLNLVGQHFWELAEGEEFSVYLKYALNVTNYSQVSTCIKLIINNSNVNHFLQHTSPGLAEISKYLLPKLLIGSIYHFLYLFETIEYLQQISTDDLDKTLLSDTLDTLKSTKYKLKELGFIDSRRRPIETSFRMFQIHQLQQLNTIDQFNDTTSNANSIVPSMSHASTTSSYSSHTTQALVSNIYSLSKNKLSEIEKNVESFKLPSGKNQSSVIQVLSNLNNSINSSSTNISNNNSTETSIKNAYLFEGYIKTFKTTQSIQASSGSILKTINPQNYKQRYAYLFDGILILVKKPMNNILTSSTKYTSKFKQALSLDKCYLKDINDDCCFELEVFNNNSISSSTFSFYQQQQLQQANQQSIQTRNNQSQEFILFMTYSSKDKYQWMSMLCYSQYKFTIDRLLQTMTEEQNDKNPLPIPPENYIFDHPDSPETILYEQSQHTSSFILTDTPLIKAATLVKLVERLTHHLVSDPKFSNTFLMCYREFCAPNKLLKLLIQRYDVPDLDNLSQATLCKYANDGIIERELLKRYKREYQQPIRLKVINFIKHWINGYFTDDFAKDSDLLQQLQEFIEKIGQTNQRYQQLANTLQKQMDTFYQQQKQKLLTHNNLNVLNNHLKSSSTNDLSTNSSDDFNDEYPSFETHLEYTGIYDILSIHPLEFARQATLMEFEIFKDIRPSELISLGWNKPERNTLSPNLTKSINLSNKLTYWYSKCIVDTLNLDERVAVMQRILEIANYFYEMNNFSGMKQIYAALEVSSVNRLRISRQKCDVEQNKIYSTFKKLFDNHDKKYLEHIKKCNPPCVPFLGSHLTLILKKKEHNKLNDENHKIQILKEQQEQKEISAILSKSNDDTLPIVSTDSINQTFTKSNLINFSKYRLLVGFVTDLLQYQSISYKFRVHDKIRSFILKDIEDTFTSAETFYNSDSESKLRNSSSSDSNHSNEFLVEKSTNPSHMVEEWLFAKSEQIESTSEAFDFPKTKRHAVVKVPAPQSLDKTKQSNKNNKNLTFKMSNRQNSSMANDINNNKSPLMARTELKKVKSLQQQPSSITSLNLFTAPYLISNLNQNTTINDIRKNETTLNTNYANSTGTISSQSSSYSSFGSFIRSSSSFNKQNRLSHKRSNSSVQISKNKDKSEQSAESKTNNKNNDNLLKSSLLTATKTNDFNTSSTSIGNSNTSSLSLTSSASALSSSIMFPTSTTASSSNMQIPFGSFYAVSSSSSSPSPPVSLLQQSNNEQTSGRREANKPTLSSSSMNAVLSSLVYGASHGHEKLSLSSADSSSSAPNSPPPNYDEVFDSSSMTTTFNFNSTINSNMTSGSLSSSSSNNNCFDNKTYFQRLCSTQQHSSSLSNLRCLEINQKLNEQQLNQQKLMQQNNNNLEIVSPSLSESSSSSFSSSNLAFSNNDNQFLKSKNKQFSVFSFPDFAEHNEQIELLQKKTSSRTSSIDILTPPPFTKISSNYLEKKNQIFSILTPPPSTPPPPPVQPPSPPQIPPLPSHLQAKHSNLSPSVSQTSINSTNMPAPPLYPPPAPPPLQIVLVNENSSKCNAPPPIPARPKKKAF